MGHSIGACLYFVAVCVDQSQGFHIDLDDYLTGLLMLADELVSTYFYLTVGYESWTRYESCLGTDCTKCGTGGTIRRLSYFSTAFSESNHLPTSLDNKAKQIMLTSSDSISNYFQKLLFIGSSSFSCTHHVWYQKTQFLAGLAVCSEEITPFRGEYLFFFLRMTDAAIWHSSWASDSPRSLGKLKCGTLFCCCLHSHVLCGGSYCASGCFHVLARFQSICSYLFIALSFPNLFFLL